MTEFRLWARGSIQLVIWLKMKPKVPERTGFPSQSTTVFLTINRYFHFFKSNWLQSRIPRMLMWNLRSSDLTFHCHSEISLSPSLSSKATRQNVKRGLSVPTALFNFVSTFFYLVRVIFFFFLLKYILKHVCWVTLQTGYKDWVCIYFHTYNTFIEFCKDSVNIFCPNLL